MKYEKQKIVVLGLMALFLASVMPADAALGDSYLSMFLMSQDPDPAEPGKYVELRWMVNKLGEDEISDIVFSLDAEYPFYFDSADVAEKRISHWRGLGNDFYVLHYKIRVDDNALEGQYKITLKHRNSRMSPGSWVSNDYDVRIGDAEKPFFAVGSLRSSPVKLVSGTDGAKLEVEIQNIGTGNAENVNVQIIMPAGMKPSYSYSDRANLGTIPAGSGKTAVFYADIGKDMKGMEYSAELSVNYRESGINEQKNKRLNLAVPVKSRPQFEITEVSLSPESVAPGSKAQIRITLKNIGDADANSVSVRAFKDSSQPIDFDERTDFVGRLRPGESGEAILTISADKNAAEKDYIIDIEVRSIFDNRVIVDEKVISVPVKKAERQGIGLSGNFAGQDGSPAVGIAVVFAIVAVGLAGYFIGAKKALKRR